VPLEFRFAIAFATRRNSGAAIRWAASKCAMASTPWPAPPSLRGRCEGADAAADWLCADLCSGHSRRDRQARALLGLSSSLLIMHASEYEAKPVAVIKGANKFSSAHVVLAAHTMRDCLSREVASSEP
jgi:hypothetical protein